MSKVKKATFDFCMVKDKWVMNILNQSEELAKWLKVIVWNWSVIRVSKLPLYLSILPKNLSIASENWAKLYGKLYYLLQFYA